VPDLDQIGAAIKKLASKQLLVGIPFETSSRAQSEWLNIMLGGKSGQISNASLGYIHERGSPARNIPARPHLIPGVEKALDEIKARLTAAARAALDGNSDMAEQYMGQAGQAAVNSVQATIRAGLEPQLAESTIIARRLRRPDIHYRERIRMVQEMEAGTRPKAYLREAQTAEATTPLIDTGSYMRAITWVIRDK